MNQRRTCRRIGVHLASDQRKCRNPSQVNRGGAQNQEKQPKKQTAPEAQKLRDKMQRQGKAEGIECTHSQILWWRSLP
jgi:hypothetical protein